MECKGRQTSSNRKGRKDVTALGRPIWLDGQKYKIKVAMTAVNQSTQWNANPTEKFEKKTREKVAEAKWNHLRS